MAKQPSFHHPEPDGTYFGRVLSTACSNAAVWVAVQMEQGGRNTIALIRRNGRRRSWLILDPQAYCHEPYILARPEGGVAVFWNEADEHGWALKCALVSDHADAFEQVETIASAPGLCLPPSAAWFGGDLWASWPAIVDDHIRIHVARRHDESWQVSGPVSLKGVDAFRPSISSTKDRVFLVWDQYRNGTYEIAWTAYDGTNWPAARTLSQEGERWFCAKAVASPNAGAYVTWVVMKEVTDDLGIVDHFPFAICGEDAAQQAGILGNHRDHHVGDGFPVCFLNHLYTGRLHLHQLGLQFHLVPHRQFNGFHQGEREIAGNRVKQIETRTQPGHIKKSAVI